ncbi:MAG: hypothetical protein CVU89_09455 [Firmicutes bacterium HGW-Firmicutes-14]|nr:MAG: hypothetical protein CVU89_09455 [Firmicutes bacterium HGW-Firmicutes-14]
MIAAVIPAKNEYDTIGPVLDMVSHLPVGLVIPVINGSVDGTLLQALRFSRAPAKIIYSAQPLGLDIPRALGAKVAYDSNAAHVLFIDGDMTGISIRALDNLLSKTLSAHLDLSLSDCYSQGPADNTLAELVLYFRRKLNKKIGLWETIGTASPSHGPHMVSRRLMEAIPLIELAVPPVSLALAAKNRLSVGIGVTLPGPILSLSHRSGNHAAAMAKTIIGDCIEAINAFEGKRRHRFLGSREYAGYHCQRNWQQLDSFFHNRGPVTVIFKKNIKEEGVSFIF